MLHSAQLGHGNPDLACKSEEHPAKAGFVKATGTLLTQDLCAATKPKASLAGFFAFWPTKTCGTSVVSCDQSATRASQSRQRGRIPRAWWLKQSGIVYSDGMAPYKGTPSRHRANFDLDHGKAVLCSCIHHQRLLKPQITRGKT